MSDFLPPEALTLEAAREALSRRLQLREGAVRQAECSFYDTFDGLLHARGLSLVRQDGELTLVATDSGEQRARLRFAGADANLRALELEPGPLRETLLAITEHRALLELAKVQSEVRALDVLDDERKTVVRMTLDAPRLIGSSGSTLELRSRLHLEPVRGYDAEFAELHAQLRGYGFVPAEQPLFDEAVTAAGGAPAGTSSKVELALSAEERADAAAAAILRRLLEVMEANLEGAIADIDSEFLHDFRVALRRARSIQRELKGVFPAAELAGFRAEFRWLQQITGEVRDLDVYILEFDGYRALLPPAMRADLDPLLGVLREHREAARQEMVAALRSERATRLRWEWASFLEQLVPAPERDRPDAAVAIGALAGRRIAKVYRRMVKMGRKIDEASPAEEYHELRKQGKELRYLLELFGASLFPAEVVKPMISALKALQDVLGRHQDREVQVAKLRSLRDQVAALPEGAAALMAMGVLVEHLYEDERAARGSFAERFAGFASSEQRKLVEETFA